MIEPFLVAPVGLKASSIVIFEAIHLPFSRQSNSELVPIKISLI